MCEAQTMAARMIVTSGEKDPHLEVLALMRALALKVEALEVEVKEYADGYQALRRDLEDLRAELRR